MLPSLLWNRDPSLLPAPGREDWPTDLDAHALTEAMAQGDAQISDFAAKTLLCHALTDIGEILDRQAVLRDAIARESAFNSLYNILHAGLVQYEDARRASQPGYARFAPMVERIRAAAGMLDILLRLTQNVRKHFHAEGKRHASRGMQAMCEAFFAFYDDDFLNGARQKQAEAAALSDGSRLCIGAKMGNGLKFADFHIRKVEPYRKLRRNKIVDAVSLETANLQSKAIALRDAALTGILHLFSAVNAQIAKDMSTLQNEIGFYLGGARLQRALRAFGVPVCFPVPHAREEFALRFSGLAGAGLALRTGKLPVGNTLSLDEARLIVITGANQGGKSTFLRSVGLAQVMMHSGLFVAAESFEASATSGLFTHFCRGEDGGMDSGKLDEELRRMNAVVERIVPHSLLLMNESFSSTTEREGSAIAREITLALTTMGARVLFVTHLYDYARSLEGFENPAQTVLLRAERNEDGERSFHIQLGVAKPTSHGLDLYEKIIGKC